ncbi:MAG: hypothetical protein KC729_14955, partial [Candidatus Eisenbacteria bacterium]|nr:hypothetical protein [Candidatus Eisenbacteria bacterium]
MRSRNDHVFSLFLLVFGLYAVVFIYNTSFVVDGVRVFSLFDDAMVSMTYARNLAEGHGLVWHAGEQPVEGFSNPAWVGFMALIHLLPIPTEKTSLLVQCAGIVILGLNLGLVRKIASTFEPRRPRVWVVSVLFTAFYLPLVNWTLQGMEVGLLALIVSFACLRILQRRERRKPDRILYLVLAASTFVRMDATVTAVALLGYLAVRDRLWRHGVEGLGWVVGAIALQTVGRALYYGDLLPNTYYLKMTGFPANLRIARGALVFLDMMRSTGWILFLVPWIAAVRRRREGALVLAVPFLGLSAYSIYVGGDAWEWWGGTNRYITAAVPGMFVLLALTTSDALEVVARHVGEAIRPAARGAIWLFLATALVQGNKLHDNPASIYQWLLMSSPLHVEENEWMVNFARVLTAGANPGDTIAVVWAGTVPYHSGMHCVDMLGKADPVISRRPMHTARTGSPYRAFFPGHLKWDYSYSIGRLQPDIISDFVGDPADAGQFLSTYRKDVV